MRAVAVWVAALGCAMPSSAQQQDEAVTVFTTGGNNPYAYRIPSLLCLNDGTLLAFTDERRGRMADIGDGKDVDSCFIDVCTRVSHNDGTTWGATRKILAGNHQSTGYDYAYGDCATVVDRATGRILLMNGSGRHGFFSPTHKECVARSVSDDGGRTWNTAEWTSRLYQDDSQMVQLFVSSGRMVQSRRAKPGCTARIYAGINTRRVIPDRAGGNGGSRVAWSDDFGETWHYLGGIAATPAPEGDECKVEELPDGNLLLSCRTNDSHGRYFNLFTFTDWERGEGSWDTTVQSGRETTDGQTFGARCNGELLLVPAKRVSDGRRMHVLLQSIPANDGRRNVSIYWKPLAEKANYDEARDFVGGWTLFPVSHKGSAYSTMTLDRHGHVAFYYEEDGAGFHGYDMRFRSLSLEEITGGAFAYQPEKEDKKR